MPRSNRPVARGRSLVAFIAAALITASGSAPAQETAPRTGTRPGDDFVYRIPSEGIPLEQLARDAELATGLTFILSDRSPLRGKIIRLSGEARVPRNEAFGLFQALFVTQGYALKPLGDASKRILVIESVDTAVDLKQHAIFLRPEELDAHRNEVGTVVMTFFPLRYIRLQNVRAALAQVLTSKSVEVTLDVESANALIVIGFAPTVYALKQIIAVMDVPQVEAELEFELISLTHAVAEELEPIILNLIESSPAGPGVQARGAPPGASQEVKPEPRIIADPRLNAFVVYAVKSDLAEIRRLIAALDHEVLDPAQNIHIYRLKHTNAEDIADVLEETFGFRGPGASRGAGRSSEKSPNQAAALPRAGRAGAVPAGISNDDIQVVAEPHNNALIVRASRTRYEAVVRIIASLDRQRPQVLIRGAVAELTDSQLKAIGAEIAALGGGSGRWHPGALTGFGLSSVSIADAPIGIGGGPGSGTGTGGGMGGGGVSQTGDPNLIRIPFFPGSGGVFGLFNDQLNVPLLVSLMQNGTHGNLISTPLVVANDNTQSTIETTRSVATQTFQSTSTGDQSSFGGYQEAKISLTISPHISNDNYVRLEVELLVESFLPATDTRPGVPPDKTGRKLVGSVTLRDGETVLVGGLVLDRDRHDQAGVPPFADAPLIGPLFRLRAKTTERASIYFFLTPTIISTLATLEHVSYEKKLEVQKLQGPVRLIDPDFRPILLDHRWIGIDGIEASGNLDLPRYAAAVPMKECGPAEKPLRDGAEEYR